MTLKSDYWLRTQGVNVIVPFQPYQVKSVEGKKVVSYGTSSFGYDIRCAPEFMLARDSSKVIDPKAIDETIFERVNTDELILPPHGFALSRSVEHISMPTNVLAICVGKSTYARCGIIVNVTPLEPGWTGYITLEISNTTPCPAKIYANEGIAQLLFLNGDGECEASYAKRDGKYMHQIGITLPR